MERNGMNEMETKRTWNRKLRRIRGSCKKLRKGKYNYGKGKGMKPCETGKVWKRNEYDRNEKKDTER